MKTSPMGRAVLALTPAFLLALFALSVFVDLPGHSFGAVSQVQTGRKAPLLTETPSATAALSSTSTGTASPTYTPYPTRTPGPTSTFCPVQFSDVPPGSTFYIHVECMACRGIISGYPDNSFRPGNNVTRGQLAKIMSNAAGYTFPIPSDRQTFEDVPPSSTFWVYVERLANFGVVRGYECGTQPGELCVPPTNRRYYRPSSAASRGQIADVEHDILGFIDPVPESRQSFEDVLPQSTFWLPVERLVERGIFQGYSCGSPGEPYIPPENRPYFRPSNYATRGQTAKITANGFFPGCVNPLAQSAIPDQATFHDRLSKPSGSTETPSATATPSETPLPTNTPYPTRTPVPTSTYCPIQFTDVPPGSTYYDYVRCLACRGIISGYPDGTFRPNNNVTRGQLAKIATLSVGYQDPIPPDRQTYEDVPIGSTFWWYIEELSMAGILRGYPCGSNANEPCIPPGNRPYFRPGLPASRGQTAKVVDNIADYGSPCIGQAFEDMPPSNIFYCGAQRLHDHGVVSGYPCGGPGEPCVPPENRPYYRPSTVSTRGQLAKMVGMLSGCTIPLAQTVVPEPAIFHDRLSRPAGSTEIPTATATPSDTVSPPPTNTPPPTRTPVPTATSCPIQFSDVPPGSTYYDYVRCLACRGVVSGYPDGTFRPNNNVTRAQLAKIATLAGGLQDPIPPDRQRFEDVPIGSTFWWYIEELSMPGAIHGYPCGGNPNELCIPPDNRPYFRPNVSASRGQVAQVVDVVAGFGTPCTNQAFEDVPPGSPFFCGVNHLYDHGGLSGYPCGGPGEPCVPPLNRPYFRPSRITTRGQLAKIIARLGFCQIPPTHDADRKLIIFHNVLLKPNGSTETPTPIVTPSETATAPPTNTPRPTRTPVPTATSCPIQFTDVPPGSTYYDYVRCLACRGVVSGYSDGTFRPNNNLTRAQLAKIPALAAGYHDPIPPDQQTFEDVPPSSTFWLYIEELYARRFIEGYQCGSNPFEPCIPPDNKPYFRPGASASRGQAAKVIRNVAGWGSPCPTQQYFEDVPPFSTFWCEIGLLYEFGVIQGYSCGGPGEPCVSPLNRPYFRPGTTLSRGQFAKMTSRGLLPQCATP